MTSAPEPGDDSTFYLCSDIETIVKAVIRAASPAHRHQMWKAYLAAMEDAAEASEDRMPWEDPEQVTRITAGHAKEVLFAVITAVCDSAERDRLAKVAAKESEIIEKRMEQGIPDSGIPNGKLPMQCCAYANCGKRYRPERPTSKYCSQACRTAAWKQRRAAVREGNGKPSGLRQPSSPGSR